MRRSRRLAGLPVDANAEELKARLDGLAIELYNMVKSLVFTTSDFMFESPKGIVPCTHDPVHAAPTIAITRIDSTWRPPRWMHVDRASRAAYSKQLLIKNTVLMFPSISVMKKWVRSFPASDVQRIGKMHLCCTQIRFPSAMLPTSPTAEDLQLNSVINLLSMVADRQEYMAQRTACRGWLAKVHIASGGSIPRSGRIWFVESEREDGAL